jgi:hypothetical protein
LDRPHTALTADARLLHPAEGHRITAGAGRTDPDRRRLDRLGHTQTAPDITASQPGHKAKGHVIDKLNRLGLILEIDHREDRAEDLFLCNPHPALDMGKDRRL